MRTRIGFAARRAQLALHGSGSVASTVEVRWVEVTGGTRTARSGTLRALSLQVPPVQVLRSYAEVEAGDLLLDTDPEGTVALADGSTTTLDALAPHGPVLWFEGRGYRTKQVGDAVAQAWDVSAGGVRCLRTLLLRPAT